MSVTDCVFVHVASSRSMLALHVLNVKWTWMIVIFSSTELPGRRLKLLSLPFCCCSISTKPPQWSVVCRRLDSNYRLILPGITARWSRVATHVKIIWHIDSVNPPPESERALRRASYDCQRPSWSVGVAPHLHSAQVGRQYIKIELDAAPASVDHVTHY